jgi:hypothetical protein
MSEERPCRKAATCEAKEAGRGKAREVGWQAVEAGPVMETCWYSQGEVTPGRQTGADMSTQTGRQRRGNCRQEGNTGEAKQAKPGSQDCRHTVVKRDQARQSRDFATGWERWWGEVRQGNREKRAEIKPAWKIGSGNT